MEMPPPAPSAALWKRPVDLVLKNVWVYFWICVFSNGLISYASFSGSVKGWILTLGLLLPTVLFLRSSSAVSGKTEAVYEQDLFGISLGPSFLWFLPLFFVFFLRFYKLTSFHFWPTDDEAQHAFLAVNLVEKWNWQFFYTSAHHPPLLIWLEYLFFSCFKDPFFNLWFPPALFSLLAVPLAYLAARSFFPRSFSLLCASLMAFSYWPLASGRFCQQGLFLPCWELASFFLLARFLNEKGKSRKNGFIFVLGLWAGLGSLTFPPWAAVIALLALTVLWFTLRGPSRAWGSLCLFLAGLCLGLGPYVMAVSREGMGRHLLNVTALNGQFTSMQAWVTSASYVTTLFWGSLQKVVKFGPVWGGVLNPLLSSCFFIGFLRLLQDWRNRKSLWILLALFLCLLPGLLSADYVEFFRVIQAMPLVLLIAGVGMQNLLSQTAPSRRAWAAVLLLMASTSLDVVHLFMPRWDLLPPFRLEEKKGIDDYGFRAYQIMDEARRQGGPGLLFTDFMLITQNHGLDAMTYAFNAASNRTLESDQSRWAAVVTDRHYQSFLIKRFPDSRWFLLGKDRSGDGDLALGLMAVTDSNRPVFANWLKASAYFHYLRKQSDGILNDLPRYQEALKNLSAGDALVQGDPFLESVFGEWKAQYFYSPTYEENLKALQGALQKGYPASHLYFKLGTYYMLGNQVQKGEEAFRMAARLGYP
jgi:4-amino-4-deoxy-L-arabinose transferase-like glycosyltransferase